MRKYLLLLLIAAIGWCLYPLSLSSQQIQYTETSKEGVRTNHEFVFTSKGAGYRIELASQSGTSLIEQTFHLAPYYGTLSWTYIDRKSRTSLQAELKEEEIHLSGTNKGKKVDKRFDIGSTVWNQFFNMGLVKFILSDASKMKFYAIGTSGPGEMKCGKFTAIKKKVENIRIMGREVTAQRIKISLSGVLSVFWSSHYWFRKADGLFLRYQDKKKFGLDKPGMTLVSEK